MKKSLEKQKNKTLCELLILLRCEFANNDYPKLYFAAISLYRQGIINQQDRILLLQYIYKKRPFIFKYLKNSPKLKIRWINRHLKKNSCELKGFVI